MSPPLIFFVQSYLLKTHLLICVITAFITKSSKDLY